MLSRVSLSALRAARPVSWWSQPSAQCAWSRSRSTPPLAAARPAASLAGSSRAAVW